MGAGRQSLGQLLFVGLEETKWTASCERVISRFQPGGVILTQRNLRNPEQTAEMLEKIARTLDLIPFLAIEEEGGTVDPLRAFFPPLPSPRRVAAKGPEKVERMGSLVGEALALLGFNLNFAPRLNLAKRSVKPSLDQQAFSSDPRTVARCGEAFVTRLRRHKVAACGKHFPGLGATQFSVKGVLPLVDKPMATLWRDDLLPFRQLLPRLAMVKLSYAAYKAYDLDLPIPASHSVNVLEGLLRVKLDYRGVSVVDPFELMREMEKGLVDLPVGDEGIMIFMDGDTAAKSISLGCDVLVVDFQRRLFELAAESLKKSLEDGSLSKRRVDEALKRIRRAKRGLRLPKGKFSKRDYDRLCRRFEDFSKECHSTE
ncbi:MAG: glycoside hydrolase family 3 N-terminal domain-containing protein [Terriglobia bacterium]|jgi:beta-N-acetylhexosaminidase